MFSGIVEETAEIVKFESALANSARLGVRSRLDHADTKLGDSVLVDGICLTVVSKSQSASDQSVILEFDLASETLRATTFINLKVGAAVHLERSLKLGERLHGHFVFGHGDGEIELLARTKQGDSERLEFKFPAHLTRFIAPKGSISIAGVSLTIGEVTSDTLSVYIIPHTNTVTRLGKLNVHEKVNVEVDQIARYVARNF